MARQSDIPSPWIGVCEIDPGTGFCRGCLRNGEEIGAWRDARDDERREILRRIATRRDTCLTATKPMGR